MWQLDGGHSPIRLQCRFYAVEKQFTTVNAENLTCAAIGLFGKAVCRDLYLVFTSFTLTGWPKVMVFQDMTWLHITSWATVLFCLFYFLTYFLESENVMKKDREGMVEIYRTLWVNFVLFEHLIARPIVLVFCNQNMVASIFILWFWILDFLQIIHEYFAENCHLHHFDWKKRYLSAKQQFHIILMDKKTESLFTNTI